MFQPTKIRKNVASTTVTVKSIIQQITTHFITKFLSFYSFISTITSNIFNDEEGDLLFDKYKIDNQDYEIASKLDIYSNLKIDKIYNHKIYNNYLDICDYKIIDNDYKFFLSKIYKNKIIHIKKPKSKTNVILDELFHVTDKLRFDLRRVSVEGFTVINKHYFFHTHWKQSLQNIHRLTYKVASKSKQPKSKMKLALIDLPKLNKITQQPYKNKKLLKKLKKIKKIKKSTTSNIKSPFYRGVDNSWLSLKKLEPFVKKKKINSTFGKTLKKSNISKSKHCFTIKNIIKLQKIAIKSNNYALYKSTNSYKKKLFEKNATLVQTLTWKKKESKYFIKLNKQLRIRWNNNILFYNKFFHNTITQHNSKYYSQKLLFTALYIKKKLKNSSFIFKNLKLFYLSSKLFKIKFLKKTEKKNLKNLFSNNLKKSLYLFYKFLKKTNQIKNPTNYLSRGKTTYITFYNTYRPIIDKLSIFNLSNKFTKKLTTDNNINILNFLKSYQIKVSDLNKFLNKNNYSLSLHDNKNLSHQLKSGVKQSMLFFKKNNFFKNTNSAFKSFSLLKRIVWAFYNYPEQFKNILKYTISQQLNTNKSFLDIKKKNSKNSKSTKVLLVSILKKKLLKLNKAHWLYKNYNKKFKKIKKLINITFLLKNITKARSISVKSNKLTKLHNYVQNKLDFITKNFIKIDLNINNSSNIEHNYQKAIGYNRLYNIYTKKLNKDCMRGIVDFDKITKFKKFVKINKLKINSFKILNYFLTANTNLKKKSLLFKLFFKKEFINIVKYSREFKLKKLHQWRFKLTRFIVKQNDVYKIISYLKEISSKRKYFDAKHSLKSLKKKTKTVTNPRFKNPNLITNKTERTKAWEDKLYKKWLFLRYKNILIDNFKLLRRQKLNEKKSLMMSNKFLKKYFYYPFSEPVFTRKWKKLIIEDFSLPLITQFQAIKNKSKIKKKKLKKNCIKLLKKFNLLSNYKKIYLKKKTYLYLKKKKILANLTLRNLALNSIMYRKLVTTSIRKKNLTQLFKFRKWKKKLVNKLSSKQKKKLEVFLDKNNMINTLKYRTKKIKKKNIKNKLKKINSLNIKKYYKKKLNKLVFFSKQKKKLTSLIEKKKINSIKMLKKNKLRNVLFKLKKKFILRYIKKNLNNNSVINSQKVTLDLELNKKNNTLISIKSLAQLNKILSFKLEVSKRKILTKLRIIYKEYPLNYVFSRKNLKKNIVKKALKKKAKIPHQKTKLTWAFKLFNTNKISSAVKVKKKTKLTLKKNKKKNIKNNKIKKNKNKLKKIKQIKKNKTNKRATKYKLTKKKLIYKRRRGDVKLQKKQQLWLNRKLLSKSQRNLNNIVLLNKNKVYTSKRAIQQVIKALKTRAKKFYNKTKNKFAKTINLPILNRQNERNKLQLLKNKMHSKQNNAVTIKKTSQQNFLNKKNNKIKKSQELNKIPQTNKKKLIKKWTYNDLVLLNLGALKPNTKNNRHSDLIKKNFIKTKNKPLKKYKGFLIQYKNSDNKFYRNSNRAARTLLKLKSQWSLNTPFVKISNIKTKTTSKFSNKLKPLIQKKIKRSTLDNKFKLNIRKNFNTKSPKNISHLVDTISELSSRYKKNFTQITEKQNIESIKFFFTKIKNYRFFKLFSNKEEKQAEFKKNKKINFIKNYGKTNILKRQKNWIFIKKKIINNTKLRHIYIQKNLKGLKNLFKMVNKSKFYNVTSNKFLHVRVTKKLYRNNKIKYSLYQFTSQLAPEISYFMQTLKTINGLVRTKFKNPKCYRLKRLKVISIMRKKKKLIKKLKLKELIRISKLPKLPKLFKPKKRTGWKKLIKKTKIKKVKKMYFYKKLKKIQKKVYSPDKISQHRLDKSYPVKPQYIKSKATFKDKKKLFSILVQVRKNNTTKVKYIINKLKNTLNKKKKNSLSLIIQKSYFYKIYNRLYKKNLIINQLKKSQQLLVFKLKISLIKKKKLLKIKSHSLNLKELIFLNKMLRFSLKKNKKNKNKIIYKSLINNINNSLGKNSHNNLIKYYSQIYKLLNRKLSKQINSNLKPHLYLSEVLSKKIKKYNFFFSRSKVLLNLKLHKKIRSIDYLIKISKKKIKKIKKKKWKKIKKKWSNLKRLALKRTYLLKKNVVLVAKYNSLHSIPIINIKLNIRNFVFLNKPAYESSLLNFYFKSITTKTNIERKNKKTLFFNFRNKKLTTYRKARQLHWKNVTHKKLNKRKYSKFIKKWVKNINNYWSTFKTHCMFKFNFSHQFWENFILLYRTVYNKALEYKTVSQLPIHTTFWWFLNLQKKLIQKVSLKLNFWQEKKIKIKKTFWMEQKKNLPKFIKKKLFRLYKSLSALHYDYITNCFIMLKNIQQPIHNNLYFINNKLLKLHDFKYKS